MTQNSIIIYAVSDATGDLAVNISIAAARQFQELRADIRRRAVIHSEEQIQELVKEAKKEGALILYTFVSSEMRQGLMEEAKAHGVTSIDVMGPVLDIISSKAHRSPSDQPGLQYKQISDTIKRTETMTFTIRHDDGQEANSLDQADIILLGISRTSKTPLSVYLAYRGHKVANVPIVRGVELPPQVYKVDRHKMVGLTTDPERLVNLRSTRLQKLGRPLDEDYASLEYVEKELAYQRQIFAKLGNIPVVNIMNKAIEEVATEVLTVLGL